MTDKAGDNFLGTCFLTTGSLLLEEFSFPRFLLFFFTKPLVLFTSLDCCVFLMPGFEFSDSLGAELDEAGFESLCLDEDVVGLSLVSMDSGCVLISSSSINSSSSPTLLTIPIRWKIKYSEMKPFSTWLTVIGIPLA